MKTFAFILSGFVTIWASSNAFASGADSSAYQGSLFNGDSTKFHDIVHSGGPHRFSVGIAVQQQKRGMETAGGWENELKGNYLNGILGCDLTKWFTLYGGVGEADVTLGNSLEASNFDWLVGGQFRMMDYLVLEPWNGIDQYWVGLDLNTFYRNTKVEFDRFTSENLAELFTSLTMSFYSKPENPWAWDRLGFYLGPALSFLDCGDQSESQMIGFIGGLQLNPSPNISMKIELQQFDKLGLGAGLTFHF